jgi:LysM repeat protein
VPKKTARTGGTRHRVRRGQTLSAIAQLYDLSPRAIAQANAIRNPSRIMAGQLLKIPEG